MKDRLITSNIEQPLLSNINNNKQLYNHPSENRQETHDTIDNNNNGKMDGVQQSDSQSYLRNRYLSHLGHLPLILRGYLPNLLPVFKQRHWSIESDLESNPALSVIDYSVRDYSVRDYSVAHSIHPSTSQSVPRGHLGTQLEFNTERENISHFEAIGSIEDKQIEHKEITRYAATAPATPAKSIIYSKNIWIDNKQERDEEWENKNNLSRVVDNKSEIDSYISPDDSVASPNKYIGIDIGNGKEFLSSRELRRQTAHRKFLRRTVTEAQQDDKEKRPKRIIYSRDRKGKYIFSNFPSLLDKEKVNEVVEEEGGIDNENKIDIINNENIKDLRLSHEYTSKNTSETRGWLPAGSIRSSVFNITSATLGAGVLTVPYALRQTGLVLGISMLIILGMISTYSIQLIVHCVNFSDLGTFEELSVAAGGKFMAGIVVFSILIFCFGCAVGYLISVADVCGAVVEAMFLHKKPKLDGNPTIETHTHTHTELGILNIISLRSLVLTCITLFVLLPLSITEQVAELRFTCFLGVAAIILLVIVVICEAVSVAELKNILFGTDTHTHTHTHTQWTVLTPTSTADCISGISLLIFAYTCQINIPSIYTELERRNSRRMMKVTYRSVGVCFSIYALIGIAAVLSLGDDTKDNILKNYTNSLSDSIPLLFAFVGMMFSLSFSYPMCVFPVRFTLDMVISMSRPNLQSRAFSVCVGVVTVLLSLVCAIFFPSAAAVFALVGASTGSFIGYIVPGFLFIKLLPGSYTHTHKAFAICLAIFGVCVALVGSVVGVLNMQNNYDE
eukprot:GHVR01093557.1.p1 GENE.GHVR01093557.1~~GHVR01093557.1.p1  ORF type:complete len:788 (+),score=212.97 GHVR01093557.1:48-2411(+)